MKRFIFTIVIVFLIAGVVTGCEKKSKKKRKGQNQNAAHTLVKVKGRTLLTDFDKNGQFEPYFIKGVIYEPMPVGRHPNDYGWKNVEASRIHNIFDDEERLRRDFELLKDMGCNTIRLWKANSTFQKGKNRYPNRMTMKTLDLAEEYGIKVIAGFWIDTKLPKCGKAEVVYRAPNFTKEGVREKHRKDFVAFVNRFKKHPAILFWAIGNANNDHLDPLDFEQLTALYLMADEMAAAAHKAEGKGYHPVAYVNGDIKTIGLITFDSTDLDLKNLDIWGVNVYRGESFDDLFEDYATRSTKPLWISEYGLDSWDSGDHTTPAAGGEDQKTQAQWIGNLWDEIVANDNITIGGTIKEYSDEWWRPDESFRKGQHSRTHDHFGFGPQDRDCNGIIDWIPQAPDNFFHEEWFGIMSVEHRVLELDKIIPKEAYYTLQEKFSSSAPLTVVP